MAISSRSRSKTSAGQCEIFFRHLATLELAAQSMVDLVVLGNDQNSARVAVEAMDDARPKLSGDVAQPIEMKLQRTGQRSAVIPFSGMHDQPGRLVEHDDRVVFMNDVERNVFRRQRAIGQLGQADRNAVVDPQLAATSSPECR